jgi:hypothetical protein
MELIIDSENEKLEIKQSITESEDVFIRRLKFILSALNLGIIPERAKILSLCFLNRILFGSAYSSALEAEIDKVKGDL